MHTGQNIMMSFWYVPSKQAVGKVKEYIFKINLYYLISWYVIILNVAGIDTIESELRRHSDDGKVTVMEPGT